MKLIKCKEDNFTLEIEPELYTIREFAELVESRKKKEGLLIKELGYIYFFADLNSDFQFQASEIERNKDLIKYLDLPSGWKRDKLLNEAIEAYRYLSQTTSSKLLQAAYLAADKIKIQLETIDLNERDRNGKPIWNLKQFNDTVKGIAETVEKLDKAEKQFIKAQEENTKLRGTKNKSVYDDLDMSTSI